ncbi:dTTP/UTP pyrophosphatase [Haloferula sargassicola]|uniref:Nucleoside triphosphate pyrophosphatase n=2 Tax=Haloferula sargassicola TaxID=490096 RepID=A0ABP9UKS8_9BACT
MEREGLDFEVRPSPADELPPGALPWDQLCQANAERKADAVDPGSGWVIAADTLVQVGGRVLGKPRDRDEARAMLESLSGRDHEVRTGVCLRSAQGMETFVVATRVRFHELDASVISTYFGKVDPLDKAGAYGIQEHGEMLVERIEGDFDNVMGLPMTELMKRLKACGAVRS